MNKCYHSVTHYTNTKEGLKFALAFNLTLTNSTTKSAQIIWKNALGTEIHLNPPFDQLHRNTAAPSWPFADDILLDVFLQSCSDNTKDNTEKHLLTISSLKWNYSKSSQ